MSIVLPSVAVTPLVIPIRNTAAALLNPASVPPRSLMAQFDWVIDYSGGSAKPNVNVLVNVQAGGAQQPIDIIRSVKIDNLGNPSPVYVYFPDTTDTIVAPPDTVVWEPVVTNSKLGNVICTGLVDGISAKTKVYFCNFFVPPYINAEINQSIPQLLASPNGGGLTGTTIAQLNLIAQGSGIAAVPVVTIGAPAIGGTQATATANLEVVGTPGVTNGGLYPAATGLTLGSVVPFSNGVSLVVAGFAQVGFNRVVTAWSPITQAGSNAGVINAGAAPTTINSTDGRGAVASVSWGVKALTITNNGAGYQVTPVVSFSNGNAVANAVLAAFPASATLRSNYGAIALGDLEIKTKTAITNTLLTAMIAPTGNFIYPTAFYVYAYDCTSAAEITVGIEDLDAVVYWECNFWSSGLNIPVVQQQGFNYRWPGTRGFRLRITGADATGRLVTKTSYSSNPQ